MKQHPNSLKDVAAELPAVIDTIHKTLGMLPDALRFEYGSMRRPCIVLDFRFTSKKRTIKIAGRLSGVKSLVSDAAEWEVTRSSFTADPKTGQGAGHVTLKLAPPRSVDDQCHDPEAHAAADRLRGRLADPQSVVGGECLVDPEDVRRVLSALAPDSQGGA